MADGKSREEGADATSARNIGASVLSWGEGSAPSIPSIDNESTHSGDIDSVLDSAIGGLSNMSSTASLTSSIYKNVEENGRTYHRFKQGSELPQAILKTSPLTVSEYPLPNDEQEQERLDLQHTMVTLAMGGHSHLAPIGPNPQNVLDFATGTGIWAIEFAQRYPSTRVLGTDLSAIQPLHVPSNCRFEIDDAEDDWTFSDKFDFIHGRAILTCFKDPASVFRQAFEALEPGGYLELQDAIFPFKYIDDPPTESHFYKWMEVVVAGAIKSGRRWDNAQHYKRWLEEIGFEDVVERKFYFPLNTWPKGDYFKQLSLYVQADLLRGLEGLSLKTMGAMGWSVEEIRDFLPRVRSDIHDTSIHGYLPMFVVYGRKPKQNS